MILMKTDRTKHGFYEIMGKYFADRRFIRELDCQLYDNGAKWYLLYDGETLCGFISAEYKGKYVLLDNFYVFEESRHKGHGTALVREAVKDNPVCKCITRNEYALKIFKREGFTECGKNGRYVKLERKQHDE